VKLYAAACCTVFFVIEHPKTAGEKSACFFTEGNYSPRARSDHSQRRSLTVGECSQWTISPRAYHDRHSWTTQVQRNPPELECRLDPTAEQFLCEAGSGRNRQTHTTSVCGSGTLGDRQESEEREKRVSESWLDEFHFQSGKNGVMRIGRQRERTLGIHTQEVSLSFLPTRNCPARAQSGGCRGTSALPYQSL